MLIKEALVWASIDMQIIPPFFVDSFLVGCMCEFGVGSFKGNLEIRIDGVECGVCEGDGEKKDKIFIHEIDYIR